MPQIRLQNISKQYAQSQAGVRSTSFSIAAGERLAIIGPSGSGKTTLLRLIAGLETPDSGELFLNDILSNRVPPHRRDVAMIAQRPALFPHLSVRGNLECVLPRVGKPDVSWDDALDLLKISSLLDRMPAELSGGEKQRVAWAKLLLGNRSIWLLDEPFSQLDLIFLQEFRHDLHLLLARSTATIVFVTHNPEDALALGQRIGVLDSGSLLQLGSTEELRSQPGNRFVALYLGNMNLIDGIVRNSDPSGTNTGVEPWFVSDCGSVQLPLPRAIVAGLQEPYPSLTLGLGPESVWCASESSASDVRVHGWTILSSEPVGSGWLLVLARGRSRVRVEWRSGSPPPVDSTCNWMLHPLQTLWFDQRTGARLNPEY